MDLDYIVVRRKVTTGGLESNPPDFSTLPGGAAAVAEKPEGSILEVHTEALDAQQAFEANAQPEYTAILNMPVALIAPVSNAEYAMAAGADPVAEAKAGGMSWGIAQVGADTSPRTGAGVKVAVLDTGIRTGHPAFAGLAFSATNCRNFVGGPAGDVTDNHGHGTHCAGTVFGRDVDGVRIGIARGVTDVLIGKVLDDAGRGSTKAVLDALRWAGDNKANVISMSLGFDFPGMVERLQQGGMPTKVAVSLALVAYRETLKLFESYLDVLMLENSTSQGTVVVAASGNESRANQDPKFVISASMPAAATQDVLSVGAAFRGPGAGLRIAPFSNINPRLSAPGVDIVSASHAGGLVQMSGTSMACPHVAGVAALHWQDNLASNGAVNATDTRSSLLARARAADFDADVPVAYRGRGNVRAPS